MTDIKEIHDQAQMLNQQLDIHEFQLQRLLAAIKVLKELEKNPTGNVLMPIADGVYVPVHVENMKEVMLHAGSDIMVKKDIPSMIALLSKQHDMTLVQTKELQTRLFELQKQADEMMKHV